MTIGIRSLGGTRRSPLSPAPSPPLTSLCDMMTILVVFLLVNFSVEGELFTPDPDVRLPVSSSHLRAQPALSVEVTAQEISLDGSPVVSVSEAMAGDDLLIRPLHESLSRRLRALEEASGSADHTPPPLTIQCDRSLDFRIVKRVVHTCSRAGGADFALLVRREEP